MMNPHYSSKITEVHLARKAIVYVRQSSRKQVLENLESQRLQFSLVERARALGWGQIETIAADLGSSASLGSAPREGFECMISAVALDEVGLILSREASRLSRTNKDWCRLLEVCQVFNTLIGDEEQVYDLNLLDDQLVLGFKGTMSVVELKVLQMRMQQGQEEKARRGELFRRLPAGYVSDASGKVVLDPDERVQEAIKNIFSKFRELWTVRQTFQWFRDHDIELPVNPAQGGTGLVWQIPTQSFIRDVLGSAFYAGAYVWGRRPVKTVFVDGKLEKRQRPYLRPEECRVFIPDHHLGYISWEEYKENQRMIRRNSVSWEQDESVAAVRAGQGLLVGLLRCGRCGRKLHVRYWGKSGTSARYLCKGDFDAGGDYCLAFGGGLVDRLFRKEILSVISPLGIEASLRAIEELRGSENEQQKLLKLQLQQVEYEADRAFEQYNESDPRNRLVAAELERRWNSKLEELESIRTRIAELDQKAVPLSASDEERIMALGKNFKEVWESGSCPGELKKKIARTLIEEIVVNTDDEDRVLTFTIRWKGETHTQLTMERPKPGAVHRTPMEALEIIRRMAVRYGDDQIASVLNRLRYRTGKGKRWNQNRVRTARRNHSIPGQKNMIPDPEILSLSEAARYCRVSHRTIERLVEAGHLKKEQVVPRAPWEIRRSDLDAEPVRGIIEHLRRTGKLVLEGGDLGNQLPLITENKGDDNAR